MSLVRAREAESGESALNRNQVWGAGIAQFLGKLLPAIRRLAADCSKKLKVGEKGRGTHRARGEHAAQT